MLYRNTILFKYQNRVWGSEAVQMSQRQDLGPQRAEGLQLALQASSADCAQYCTGSSPAI